MRGRGKGLTVGIIALAGLLLAAVSPAGAGGPSPQPAQGTVRVAAPGQAFSFALWGDLPYVRNGDAPRMTALVQDMNRAPIAFSVFDGDIKDGSSLCTDDQFSGAIE